MAANYWESTQRRFWTFSKEDLDEVRQKLEDGDRNIVQQFPLPDRRLVSIFIHTQLMKLSKRLQTRQQALATAQIYIKRFYTKVEIRRTNPYLVLTTAFYLACKMEECPQHIRLVLGEARNFWPEYIVSDVSKLGECEFSLISEMSSHLIIHHPYRFLSDFRTALGMSPDEFALAWSIINDHYLTDLPLLYAPHVIAVMAIFMGMVFKPGQGSGAAAAAANAAAITPHSGSANGGGSGAMQTRDATSLMASMFGSGANQARGINPAQQQQQHRQQNIQQQLASLPNKPPDPSSSSSDPTPPIVATTTNTTAAPTLSAKVQKLTTWLASSEVDIEAAVECVQSMISLYEVWDQYSEKAVKDVFGRFVKGRGVEK